MKRCVPWILSGLLCLVYADHQEDPYADMYQREIDPSHLFLQQLQDRQEDSHADMYQREIDPSPLFLQKIQDEHPRVVQQEIMSPRGRRPASRGTANLNNFPPGKPTEGNIVEICRKSRTRVTYGAHNLPKEGFSHLYRQGDAMNSMEEEFSRCCAQAEKLRCALDAWKNAMDNFCQEEFSVKTSHYHCCKKRGIERETCFTDEAPNPNYIISAPLVEMGSADVPVMPAMRSLKPCSPHSSKCFNKPNDEFSLTSLAFPPGEPKANNIHNICKLRKYRPVYTNTKRAPGHYERRANAINQLENKLKTCCKTEDVECAHSKWQEVLSHFCLIEGSVKTRLYECCKKPDQTTMFHCFATNAPFPKYDKEVETLNLDNITENILEKVCNQSKLLTKQKQIPTLISALKDSCCSFSQDEKLKCVQNEKEKFMTAQCGPRKDLWKDRRNCCSKPEPEKKECFQSYLQNISMVVSHRITTE